MANLYDIKQVTLDELPQAADLFNQYRIFYQQQSDLEGAEKFLRERINKQESVIFVAQKAESDTYVGFCQLYPSFSSISMKRSWILNDLFVHAEYRGQGIGLLLLEQARQGAIVTGVEPEKTLISQAVHQDRNEGINIEYVQSFAEQYDAPSESVDIVTALFLALVRSLSCQ